MNIQIKISRVRSESLCQRIWRHFKSNGQLIKDLQRDFDDALKLCSVGWFYLAAVQN